MQLKEFSIKNYRSITKAHKIAIGDLSVLVGKNNEGKSNVLNALNIAMTILTGRARSHGRRRYGSRQSRHRNHGYDRERDFPISLKDKKNIKKETVFRLDFLLNEQEKLDFKKEIKSTNNGTLKFEIIIGEKGDEKVKVIKKGRGSKTFERKSKKIREYIANKIYFNYIPAVRTSDHTISIVEDIVGSELFKIRSNPEYAEAIEKIQELQRPILEGIGEKIKTTLSSYIQDINTVELITEERRNYSLRHDCDIIIDDGNKTSLSFKGDGVISLAALGLLKDYQTSEKFSLIAIEEPEAHLHPGAIHKLRDTLFDLSEKSQVLISSHNPLFVNRENISSNIIVGGGTAKKAKDISEVRNVLGVRASDNLSHSSFVLLVEGKSDSIAIRKILKSSTILSNALSSNLLTIDFLQGAGNLGYKLGQLESVLCTPYCFLDDDEKGRNSIEKSKVEGLIKEGRYNLSICAGLHEAELEDCIEPETYSQLLINEFGININCHEFKKPKKKWSEKLKNTFLSQGKRLDKTTLTKIKIKIANSIIGYSALSNHRKSSIDALIKGLERMIGNYKI